MTDQHTCEYVATTPVRFEHCDEPATHVARVNTRNDEWPESGTGPGLNFDMGVCEDCIAKLEDDPEFYVIETWATEPV